MIDHLRLHGVRFETVRELQMRTRMLDRVSLRDVVVQRAQDGRLPITFDYRFVVETLPNGKIRVRYDRPLGLPATALLEPEASNSFLV